MVIEISNPLMTCTCTHYHHSHTPHSNPIPRQQCRNDAAALPASLGCSPWQHQRRFQIPVNTQPCSCRQRPAASHQGVLQPAAAQPAVGAGQLGPILGLVGGLGVHTKHPRDPRHRLSLAPEGGIFRLKKGGICSGARQYDVRKKGGKFIS